jgi:phasin family protein
MNESVFPPLAIFQRPVFEVARKSTELMRSGADKIVQINFYASLAAIDNSTHHFSTLVNSQSIDDLIELQLQSFLPAAEGVKAYIGQLTAIAAASSHEYLQHIEVQMTGMSD